MYPVESKRELSADDVARRARMKHADAAKARTWTIGCSPKKNCAGEVNGDVRRGYA